MSISDAGVDDLPRRVSRREKMKGMRIDTS